MANFLSNLVQRFNQPTPAVQARPVSLFEPQTQLDLSPWVGAEQNAVESEPPPTARRQIKPTPSDIPSTPIDSRPVQPSNEPHPQSLAAPLKEKLPMVVAHQPPAQLGYLVVRTENQVEMPLTRPDAHPQVDPAPPKGAARLEPERAANPKAESQPRGGPPTPGPEKVLPKTAEPASIRPKPRAAENPLGVASIPLQNAAKAAPDSSEAIINVTIGRVEVIATPPAVPARPPKASRPSPVMSLDEYLKSRDQERQP